MKRPKLALWSGLLLTLTGIASYFALFSRWPVTRDIPWTAFVFFLIAIPLLISGVRRAQRKLMPSILAGITAVIILVFSIGIFAGSRLPQSSEAPAVGKRAPDFTLPDVNHHNISLTTFLAEPSTKQVLLIFYRGYW